MVLNDLCEITWLGFAFYNRFRIAATCENRTVREEAGFSHEDHIRIWLSERRHIRNAECIPFGQHQIQNDDIKISDFEHLNGVVTVK